MRNLELENPALAAMTITIGIITAVVLVFERNADKEAVIIIIANNNCFSVLANLVIRPPIFLATPVSNRDAPMTNIPVINMTTLFVNPEKAVAASITPVMYNSIVVSKAVTATGSFSVKNKTDASRSISKVIIAGDI